MKDIERLLDIVKPALDRGITMELSSDRNGLEIDVNTGMKSHCILYIVDGEVIASMRYGVTEKVEDFNDLLSCVRSCVMGRDYGHGEWFSLLKENGYNTDLYIEQ